MDGYIERERSRIVKLTRFDNGRFTVPSYQINVRAQ